MEVISKHNRRKMITQKKGILNLTCVEGARRKERRLK
jgi:hypothetical protein